MDRIQIPAAECSDIEYRRLLTTACQAALTAGNINKQNYDQPHTVTMKGTINLVTETDLAAEAASIDSLEAACPELPIMTEESTTTHKQAPQSRFRVVDPLDGTTNFAHGFPFFAVSIAFVEQDKPLIAAIYAPMFNELFCATKGGGAWLNGSPIRVSGKLHLIEALLGTGFPYELDQTLSGVMRQLETIISRVRDIRRAGAAALDLAYVACGRLDGFYEINLQPWDTAAGWLLVEEAGGCVSDFSGGAYSPFLPEILASNNKLHQPLLQLLQ